MVDIALQSVRPNVRFGHIAFENPPVSSPQLCRNVSNARLIARDMHDKPIKFLPQLDLA
jgi:hypothetical protein